MSAKESADVSNRASIVADVIRTRRTVGAFKPDPPERELVLRALELACWAPNHHKTEPWRFHLLGRYTAERVVELNARLIAESKGAAAADAKRRQWSSVPGWIVVTCIRSGDELQQEEDFAACCCAIQNLMLALWSDGVATKWSTAGVMRHPQFFDLLQLNAERDRVVGLIWYGYPDKLPEQQRTDVRKLLHELP